MTHTITPRVFLTASEVARYIGGKANAKTVSNLIRSGRMKGKKVSNGWRILPEWLDEFMSQPDEVKRDNK